MYHTYDWVIIQAAAGYYKVLATVGRRMFDWRINSGITNIVDNGDTLHVIGVSGSVYEIRRDEEGVGVATGHILSQLVKRGLAKPVLLSDVDSSNFIKARDWC